LHSVLRKYSAESLFKLRQNTLPLIFHFGTERIRSIFNRDEIYTDRDTGIDLDNREILK